MTATLFQDDALHAAHKQHLDEAGYLLLPNFLTAMACTQLTAALARIQDLTQSVGQPAQRYSAEHDAYLASLIAHPQMLSLAHSALGADIRFDHCVSLNRDAGDQGIGWHSHPYGEAGSGLNFLRIFLYVNGFAADDGALKVVPGSHLNETLHGFVPDDAQLESGWLQNKTHPHTGEPLHIETLAAPAASVILVWTDTLHAVTPRKTDSPMRWTVVYAYRNPGAPSHARWITPAFENNPPQGAEGLMPLY